MLVAKSTILFSPGLLTLAWPLPPVLKSQHSNVASGYIRVAALVGCAAIQSVGMNKKIVGRGQWEMPVTHDAAAHVVIQTLIGRKRDGGLGAGGWVCGGSGVGAGWVQGPLGCGCWWL